MRKERSKVNIHIIMRKERWNNMCRAGLNWGRHSSFNGRKKVLRLRGSKGINKERADQQRSWTSIIQFMVDQHRGVVDIIVGPATLLNVIDPCFIEERVPTPVFLLAQTFLDQLIAPPWTNEDIVAGPGHRISRRATNLWIHSRGRGAGPSFYACGDNMVPEDWLNAWEL